MNKILFVDDDITLLKANQHRFNKRFDVDIAQGGKDGLAVIAEKGPFSVIVSDLLMPVMDGFEFIENACKLSPGSVFMILSGHANLDASLKALNEGKIFKFLVKPYKMHVLEKAIDDGIEQYQKNLQMSRMPQSSTTGFYRRKLLFVDDDPEILSIFSAEMTADDQFDVLTAENGHVALTILGLMQMDMVIVDRMMPEMDGIELLTSIRRKDPEIVLLLSTWHTSSELEQQVAGLNLSGILEKPLDMRFVSRTIQESLQADPRGQIDGIGTASFLQMIEMEEKTCTLHFQSGKRLGRLFFQKGHLISAETNDLQDEQAAIEIINWKDAAIRIEHADKKRKPRINRPLMHILMEAARKQDELDEYEALKPDLLPKTPLSMEMEANGR